MVQWHWNQIESGGAKLIRNLESCQAKKKKEKKERIMVMVIHVYLLNVEVPTPMLCLTTSSCFDKF